ncbi:DUF1330 domain-containing protein [Mesorhizobium sp. M2E.F.Ca.ET.209.01.1.1]|nr:DUF1330 domain-containing protein [Mesorhizobium sp. M2E.F.Ca.ET.209.01.1.1]
MPASISHRTWASSSLDICCTSTAASSWCRPAIIRERFSVKGYWLIVGTEISDQEAQAEYARLWKPIGEKYQARTNTTKQPPLLVEARDAKRMVLVEFPSLEIAKACYADPAYAQAIRFALKASNRTLVMFEGDLG